MTFNATIKFGFVNSLTFDLGLGYLQFTSWNLAAVSRTLSVVPTVIVLVRIHKLKDVPNSYFLIYFRYLISIDTQKVKIRTILLVLYSLL